MSSCRPRKATRRRAHLVIRYRRRKPLYGDRPADLHTHLGETTNAIEEDNGAISRNRQVLKPEIVAVREFPGNRDYRDIVFERRNLNIGR